MYYNNVSAIFVVNFRLFAGTFLTTSSQVAFHLGPPITICNCKFYVLRFAIPRKSYYMSKIIFIC
jgi:hypothetical protein